ncbi:MAG TPA: hypothetical protein VJ779_22775 [Acetobacteraceae bacterium]|jgi:hypothetical protein|nr:hypothetical protein [Acetobacteraceae bacterium]
MRYLAVALCALAPFALSITPSHAQQSPSGRDCDAGAARRQLSGQPMTDYLAACRSAQINPENLQGICARGADSNKLSGAARNTYMQDCTKGPD